jgi:hypothetical protein
VHWSGRGVPSIDDAKRAAKSEGRAHSPAISTALWQATSSNKGSEMGEGEAA